MPIVVALLVLCALIYGAVWSYDALLAHFGLAVAAGAAVFALLVVAALIAWLIQRHRDVAPNAAAGPWTHELLRDWGTLQLSAPHRLLKITLGTQSGEYIFADLGGALAQPASQGWQVAVAVHDRSHPQWVLPMPSKREARRWERIVHLAMAQKL